MEVKLSLILKGRANNSAPLDFQTVGAHGSNPQGGWKVSDKRDLKKLCERLILPKLLGWGRRRGCERPVDEIVRSGVI